MAILKEWRCVAHGIFENTSGRCKSGCPQAFVKQEIRTAPAYRRPNMGRIDSTLRMIAHDHGLTDLKNDPKANISVLQALQKTKDVDKPRWMSIPHAKPGFSQTGDKAPVFDGKAMGFLPSAATGVNPPPIRTKIVGSYKG